MEQYPTERQTRLGWGYFLIQLFFLSGLFPQCNSLLGSPLKQGELNFCYYLCNFICVCLIFGDYLLEAFRKAPFRPRRFGLTIALGFFGFLLISRCFPQIDNPNNVKILDLFQESPRLMLVGTVLLAPVAEECFFRELIFHRLYEKNRLTAYLISAILFAGIHVLGFLGQTAPVTLAVSFLQYIPAGLILAGCYEAAGSLAAPILVHGLLNAYSALTVL